MEKGSALPASPPTSTSARTLLVPPFHALPHLLVDPRWGQAVSDRPSPGRDPERGVRRKGLTEPAPRAGESSPLPHVHGVCPLKEIAPAGLERDFTWKGAG
jgi:hypothetical protein